MPFLIDQHGNQDTVRHLCTHPDVQGISFVGGNTAGRAIYEMVNGFIDLLIDQTFNPSLNVESDNSFSLGW